MTQISLKDQYEEKALLTLSNKERQLIESQSEVKIRDILNSIENYEVEEVWEDDKPAYKRELNPTEYTQYKIGEMLENGYSLVGIPYENYPPEDIAFVLAHNVIAGFGHFSLQDIVRAFNSSCTGETNISFHPFKQPVGWLYINNILTQYSIYKTKQVARIDHKISKVDIRDYEQIRADIITNRKKDDVSIKQSWIKLYEWTINEEEYNFNYIQESHYIYLKQLGLLELIEKEKESLMPIAKARLKKERYQTSMQSMVEKFKKQIATSEVERTYKKICVEKWLKKVKTENMSIDDFKNHLKKICYISEFSTQKLLQHIREKESSEK